MSFTNGIMMTNNKPDLLNEFYFGEFHKSKEPDFFKWALSNAKKCFPGWYNEKELRFDENTVYRHVPLLDEFVDKSIIVVGGGPSTDTLTINDFLCFDHIFSVNNFFLHKYLKKLKVSFATLGFNVQAFFKKKEFIHYIREYKPILGFQCHIGWEEQKDFLYRFHPNDRKIFHESKFYGQLGVGIKVIQAAAAFGVKKISFVGFDGPKAIFHGKHVFQPGKRQLPPFVTRQNADEVHYQHYTKFWQYMQNLYPNVTFESIDKRNRYHFNVS